MEETLTPAKEAVLPAETKATPAADDLLSRLSAATVKKEPGKSAAPANKTASALWDASEDDFEPVKQVANPVKSEKQTSETEKQTAPKPLGDQDFRFSAENTTDGIELVVEGICTFVVNKQFRNKFKDEEIHKIHDKLADADPKTLPPEELSLKQKWDRLLKKKDQKLSEIPFTPDEKERSNDAWFKYYKQTQTQMGPGFNLALAMGSIIGSRVIDVCTD